MALLRLLCFPSTTSSFVTQPSSSLCSSSSSSSSSPLSLSYSLPTIKTRKPTTNFTFHVSCSSSSSLLSLSYSLHTIKTRKPTTNFTFHVSCSSSSTTSSASTVSIESPELEPVEEAAEEEDDGSSGNRLIAQNVPWSSKPDDIRKLFEKHGTVVDVELSMHNRTRNRGLAFVTMGSPEEAVVALENLQSYEFEGRTLNINWARPQKKKSTPSEQPKVATVYNLFVANMSYEARSKDLRKFFEGGGWKVYTAEVIFHEDTRKSSGYGFVSFTSKEDADAALAAFQGKELMGRPIRLARSKRFSRHETRASAPEGVSTGLNPQQTDTVEQTVNVEQTDNVEQPDNVDEI